MGKRDDQRPGNTRPLDPVRLATLAKQPLPEGATVAEDEVPVAVGRTQTVSDPLTTSLLAEVARRSQTAEFDEDAIQGVLDQIDSGDTNHPHTRRRAK